MNKEDKYRDRYKLIYKKILNYTVPIAIQCSVLNFEDLSGDIIKHDDNKNIEPMQIAVFPLKEKSIVLLFVHEKDKIYDNLIRQFNDEVEDEKIKIINYLVFKYSDEFLLGESIDINLLNKEFIKEIMPTKNKISAGKMTMDEYPNFLAENFSM